MHRTCIFETGYNFPHSIFLSRIDVHHVIKCKTSVQILRVDLWVRFHRSHNILADLINQQSYGHFKDTAGQYTCFFKMTAERNVCY